MGRPRLYFFNPGDRIGDWLVLRDGIADSRGSPTYVVHCTLCDAVTRTVLARDLGRRRSTGCGCRRHVKLHEASLKHGEALQVGDTPAYGRWQTLRKWFKGKALEMPDWLATFEAFREATPTVPVGFQLQRPDRSRPWALDNMEVVPVRRATSRTALWAYHAARRPGEAEARREYRRRRREATRRVGHTPSSTVSPLSANRER